MANGVTRPTNPWLRISGYGCIATERGSSCPLAWHAACETTSRRRRATLHATMAGRAVLAGHSVLSGLVARTGSHFEAANQRLRSGNAVEQHVGADEARPDGASLLNVVFCGQEEQEQT